MHLIMNPKSKIGLILIDDLYKSEMAKFMWKHTGDGAIYKNCESFDLYESIEDGDMFFEVTPKLAVILSLMSGEQILNYFYKDWEANYYDIQRYVDNGILIHMNIDYARYDEIKN